ncbi:hypothetical protein BDY19DRAFT_887623 [Irpex rosettiformis]|uniref:Uncharacterized protein n=1 Tax=Irpex rosettiformis TaxID=378272 RepID=A0ACB8U7F2_9APHY|nr:hypothetical protein BDY19DRAFT_887623 [Irpex rosettiformis]
MIICFGPTEDDFIISYGVQAYHSNAPSSIIELMENNPDWDPMRIGWISIHQNFTTAVFMSWVTGTLAWTADLPKELEGYIEHPGLANTVSYLAFADSDDGFFIKFRPGGGPNGRSWILNVRPDYPDQVEILMSEIPNFSDRLRYILFGHGGTHIYVFDTGFCAHFEGEAKDPEHPLHKTIEEFNKPGWTLRDGSSLSLYDDNYFCLKFVHAESNEIFMRFNLPIKMHERLMELVEETEKPDVALGRSIRFHIS